jgi:hypothetical protein
MPGGTSRRLLADLVFAAENTVRGPLQRRHIRAPTLAQIAFTLGLLDCFEFAAPVAPDAAGAKENGDPDGDKDEDLEGDTGQL